MIEPTQLKIKKCDASFFPKKYFKESVTSPCNQTVIGELDSWNFCLLHALEYLLYAINLVQQECRDSHC